MGKKERAPTYKKACDGRNELIILAEGIAISVIIAILFFESVWGMCVFPLAYMFNRFRYLEKYEREKEEKFLQEFKDLLLSVSSSLQTGYSIEKAFKEGEKELEALNGKSGEMLKGLREINHKVSVAVPIEKAFMEFAREHPSEEVINFAEIFVFAKRLGGDYGKNIRSTAMKIEEKIAMKQEIAMLTAEKRMEMNVMSVMPVAIIAYVKISSYGFLEGLYHNPLGIAVMIMCLVVYAVAIFIGNKIVEINV